jgi:hypothetical protein
MLKTHRPRGRPRTRQTAPDQGTIELQRQREAKRQLLPLHLQAPPQDINAYLAGSHLHAFYLMGWISQEIFLSTLAYAKLMHRAFRSMGLRCTLKSYLLPQHERSGQSPSEDRRAENLWYEISCQLKVLYQPKHQQLLMRLLAMTAAPWPSRDEICFVLQCVDEVMQGRKVRKGLKINPIHHN